MCHICFLCIYYFLYSHGCVEQVPASRRLQRTGGTTYQTYLTRRPMISCKHPRCNDTFLLSYAVGSTSEVSEPLVSNKARLKNSAQTLRQSN